jgi:hypothetical protein
MLYNLMLYNSNVMMGDSMLGLSDELYINWSGNVSSYSLVRSPILCYYLNSTETNECITIADIYLGEADELLEKGDVIQASEKYYKAAEESIKILAKVLNLEIVKNIRDEEWSGKLLDECVFSLSSILGKWVIESWGTAIALLTVNFDEQQVRTYKKDIEKLVQVARERCNKEHVKGS